MVPFPKLKLNVPIPGSVYFQDVPMILLIKRCLKFIVPVATTALLYQEYPLKLVLLLKTRFMTAPAFVFNSIISFPITFHVTASQNVPEGDTLLIVPWPKLKLKLPLARSEKFQEVPTMLFIY